MTLLDLRFGRASAVLSEPRILRWQSTIRSEAQEIGAPPSLVAAIISRETGGLDEFCLPPPIGKLGDNGRGHGPMQIDIGTAPYWCERWRKGELSTEDGIHMGCQILSGKMKSIARILPTLKGDERLHAVASAFNCGEGNVRKSFLAGTGLDLYTAWHNYGSDVMERAAYFIEKGY